MPDKSINARLMVLEARSNRDPAEAAFVQIIDEHGATAKQLLALAAAQRAGRRIILVVGSDMSENPSHAAA
ncbi:MAG: hypothetical protein ABIP49_04245 [Lysobacterales bacterium]